MTVIGRPLVSFGREICGDLDAALRREWLVTNGVGGYASGTVAGINTRRYHGLLIASLTPCVDRVLLVGGVVEEATYDGRMYLLSANEFGDGTIDPHGYRYLQSFELRGMLPVWTFAVADALIERRVWMAYGANTTYVSYRLTRGTLPLGLRITPLVTYSGFHALTSGKGWSPAVEAHPRAATIRAFEDARPYTLTADRGSLVPNGACWWNFKHREETARGLDDRSDLYAPGTFAAELRTNQRLTLVCSCEARPDLDGARSLKAAEDRQLALLDRAGASKSPAAVQQLTLAADQFLVRRFIGSQTGEESSKPPRRGDTNGSMGRSVIAGYHWFNDWGRDTMISLPGLALATGREPEAAEILRTFARYVADGLLPNNFPDNSGAEPEYNTVDATLWYVLAVRACYEATHEAALVDDLLPVMRYIVECHIKGTRYAIRVDPADGLLSAGEPGVQLTWMDARVGDRVITPRTGKPVEINALWYNVLRAIAELLDERGDPEAKRYVRLAKQTLTSFRSRFVVAGRAHLADVVDGPEGDDLSVRPNQIFAVSLPYPLLKGAQAAAVVDAVGRDLLTSYGLRSLAACDPAYQGICAGDQAQRDGAYHQGTVWSWLIAPYAEAHFRVHGDAAAALAVLQPLEMHLSDAGLGSISEIFDGDPPHFPRGAIAQAWGVAEVLRVWRLLARAAADSG